MMPSFGFVNRVKKNLSPTVCFGFVGDDGAHLWLSMEMILMMVSTRYRGFCALIYSICFSQSLKATMKEHQALAWACNLLQRPIMLD